MSEDPAVYDIDDVVPPLHSILEAEEEKENDDDLDLDDDLDVGDDIDLD